MGRKAVILPQNKVMVSLLGRKTLTFFPKHFDFFFTFFGRVFAL